jgi:hypothetical protein
VVITENTELMIDELKLWQNKGNTLFRLFNVKSEAGKLTLNIPKYDNSGCFTVKGFSSYSGALSFFGSLVDSATSS